MTDEDNKNTDKLKRQPFSAEVSISETGFSDIESSDIEFQEQETDVEMATIEEQPPEIEDRDESKACDEMKTRVEKIEDARKNVRKRVHPFKSMVVRISGTRKDAVLYAKSWLADQGSVRGYWFIEKLGDDQLLEIHDGGDGFAYLPPAIKKIKENGGNVGFVIPGTEYALAVELNDSSLSKLTLPADDFDADARLTDPVEKVMTPYVPKPEILFLLVSMIVLIIAVGSFFSAIKVRAIPYTVTIKQTQDYHLWNVWESKIKPNAGANPDFVKYENGRWTWQVAKVGSDDAKGGKQ